MAGYYVDVRGKSKEEVSKIAKKIRQDFPQLTEGYRDVYYFDLQRSYSFITLCWWDDGCFLGWGHDPARFGNKYSVGCNNLGRM